MFATHSSKLLQVYHLPFSDLASPADALVLLYRGGREGKGSPRIVKAGWSKLTLLDERGNQKGVVKQGSSRELARIIQKFPTAAEPSSALTAFRSVDLLDVLHEYERGGLGRKPCQDGVVTALLRKLLNYAGCAPADSASSADIFRDDSDK